MTTPRQPPAGPSEALPVQAEGADARSPEAACEVCGRDTCAAVHAIEGQRPGDCFRLGYEREKARADMDEKLAQDALAGLVVAESRGAKAGRAEAAEYLERCAQDMRMRGAPWTGFGLLVMHAQRIRSLSAEGATPSGSPSVPAAQQKDQANQGAAAQAVERRGIVGVTRQAAPTCPHWNYDPGCAACVAYYVERAPVEPRAAPSPALPREAPEPGGALVVLLREAAQYIFEHDCHPKTPQPYDLLGRLDRASEQPRAAPSDSAPATPGLPLEAVSGGTQEGLEALLGEARHRIRIPDNGWHHCRWCSKSDATQPHMPGCWFAAECLAIDSLCIRIDAALASALPRSAPPSPDSPSQGERKQQLLDQDRAPSARSVLTELLRLYDWRFVLAEREKNPINDTGPVFRAETQRLLRQYGTEKKAAWGAARLVLAPDKPAAGPSSPSSASLESGGGTLDRNKAEGGVSPRTPDRG